MRELFHALACVVRRPRRVFRVWPQLCHPLRGLHVKVLKHHWQLSHCAASFCAAWTDPGAPEYAVATHGLVHTTQSRRRTSDGHTRVKLDCISKERHLHSLAYLLRFWYCPLLPAPKENS